MLIAHASIISLPADFVANIGSTTTDLLGSFSPYILFVIGLLLVGVILEIVISAIRHR